MTFETSWYHAAHLRAAIVPFVLLCSALAACAAGPPPEAGPERARTRAKPEPRVKARWARYDEVSAWPPANPAPFASRGHGTSTYVMDVRVSEGVRESYLALRPDLSMPNGTVVAAFHKDARTGRAGPVYVMERQSDAWKYSAFEADGRATEHGVLTLCERCHAESPSGGLFGLPR